MAYTVDEYPRRDRPTYSKDGRSARYIHVDPDSVQEYIRPLAPELRGHTSIRLREAFYELKHQEELSSDELKEVVWESAKQNIIVFDGRDDCWSHVSQYLALLPSIRPPVGRYPWYDEGLDHENTSWLFDTTGNERPEPPDKASEPPEDIHGAISNLDVLDGHDLDALRYNSIMLRDLYGRLMDAGVEGVTFEVLRENTELLNSSIDKPDKGWYVYEADWMADVGRPALAELPGVDPPRVAGGPWRFVGL